LNNESVENDKKPNDKPKESELTDSPSELDRSKNLDSEGEARKKWKDESSSPKK